MNRQEQKIKAKLNELARRECACRTPDGNCVHECNAGKMGKFYDPPCEVLSDGHICNYLFEAVLPLDAALAAIVTAMYRREPDITARRTCTRCGDKLSLLATANDSACLAERFNSFIMSRNIWRLQPLRACPESTTNDIIKGEKRTGENK